MGNQGCACKAIHLPTHYAYKLIKDSPIAQPAAKAEDPGKHDLQITA
jgi:hypothetical protein